MSILNFNASDFMVERSFENEKSFQDNFYKCNPKLSKSEDGHYRSVIKVIYNPHNLMQTLVERQVYSMTDENGWFSVVSSLSNGDTNCPIFKAWKSLRYSKDPVKESCALPESKGGKGWFNKKTERWVTIQVIEDVNQPELVGRYLFWKLPATIWRMIDAKQNPSPESGKAPIPVFDFLIGRAIELDVTPGPDDPADPSRKNREIKYDLSNLSDDPVQCINTDGTPLLTDDQQEIVDEYMDMMKKVWKARSAEKRDQLQAEVMESDTYKAFDSFYETEILDKIKADCGNVYEELSYKPWDEQTTSRVNAWLTKVTNGIDPSTVAINETVDLLSSDAPSESKVETVEESSEEDVDLPF
jgi:hypothetical protein